jgi:hypothetical protein
MGATIGEEWLDLGRAITARVMEDEQAREAFSRFVQDAGLLLSRANDVWPEFNGRIIKLAMRSLTQ